MTVCLLFSFTSTLYALLLLNRASAAVTVDLVLISGRVKPKTTKIGFHSFPLDVQQLKGQCESATSPPVNLRNEQIAGPFAAPSQGNVLNKDAITITSLRNIL